MSRLRSAALSSLIAFAATVAHAQVTRQILRGAEAPAARVVDKPAFRVIAFFTAKQDQAHISFVRESERWFPAAAAKYNFSYDTTSNWHW